MLKVPTFVAPSRIAGLGLFAARKILRGEVVWQFVEGFDRRYTPAEFEALPEAEKKDTLFWGYFNERTGNWIVCGDEGRRVNHSDTPNLGGGYQSDDQRDEGFEYALRDIEEGEELTDNYKEYDRSWKEKLSSELAPSGN